MPIRGEVDPQEVLYRIKRGLSGYISYLATCEMNQAFSEYVLYEPTLRILTARGYAVRCEVPCDEQRKSGRGDHKRIDFEATKDKVRFAIEMKWARKKQVDVAQDYQKLKSFHTHCQKPRAFLCIFGRRSHIESLILKGGAFVERGRAVYAEFGVTRYGCRTYEIHNA